MSKTRPILLAMVLGLAACNNDDAVTPPSQDTETGAATSTGTTTSAGTTTSGADTTESASAGATGSTSSGSDSGSTGSSGSTGESSESTTGEPVVPGRTMSQLVSAGTRTSSPSYTLVHTLGQPSSLQSTHVSTSYRLQGGLVGANGSPP